MYLREQIKIKGVESNAKDGENIKDTYTQILYVKQED